MFGVSLGQWLRPAVKRRIALEVKIGIQMAQRELVVETPSQAEEVEQTLTAAIKDGTVFVLTDDKGGTVLVPADKIAYVEIGRVEPRRIGFGNA